MKTYLLVGAAVAAALVFLLWMGLRGTIPLPQFALDAARRGQAMLDMETAEVAADAMDEAVSDGEA